MIFAKRCGRAAVMINDAAMRNHRLPGASVAFQDGFESTSPITEFAVSVEELRDLRYLIDRAIAAANEEKRRRL